MNLKLLPAIFELQYRKVLAGLATELILHCIVYCIGFVLLVFPMLCGLDMNILSFRKGRIGTFPAPTLLLITPVHRLSRVFGISQISYHMQSVLCSRRLVFAIKFFRVRFRWRRLLTFCLCLLRNVLNMDLRLTFVLFS